MPPDADTLATEPAELRAALLAALRLQSEWGADEALEEQPVDRLRAQDREPQRAMPPGPGRASSTLPAAPPGPAAPQGAQIAAREAADLSALLAAWGAFDGCALRRTAASTILPQGDPAAPLLLVAEAPDAEDDRAGAAFAGPAGRFLDRMLASIGLARDSLRIAFLSPWRPPGGRTVSESELRACLPFLQRYILLAPPKRLVLLGTLPARALTGSADGLRRARGRWRDAAVPGLDAPIPAMASYPPGQVAAQPALRRDAWADLLLLRRTLDGAEGPGK